MENTGRFALTANGKPAAFGPEKAIERLCKWNRVANYSGIEWDMFWVTDDKTVDPTAPAYLEPPSGPLVAKLFDLLQQTSIIPQYHYEMWWCVKFLMEMESPGLALIRTGNYSCGYRHLSAAPTQDKNTYFQDVEDAHGSYSYWLDDFKRGESKEAILVTLSNPANLDGDALLLQQDAAIKILEMHIAGLPPRPIITRDERNIHFYTGRDRLHYESVKLEAESNGLLEQFNKAIRDRCINYASHKVWYRCALSKDFAPMSFGWRPEYKESPFGEWMPMFPGGGGLIYHDYCKDWSTHT